MRCALLAVLVLAAASCADVPGFRCDNEELCGAAGRCEEDQACSFVDDACHAGWRSGGEGDDRVADRCVGDSSGAIAWLTGTYGRRWR